MLQQPRLSDQEAQHHEKMLLGAILGDPSNVVQAAAVKPAFFRVSKHRIIFMAIMDLHRSGTSVNLLNVVNVLAAKRAMSIAGGTAYLAELVSYAQAKARDHNAAALRAGVRQAGGDA